MDKISFDDVNLYDFGNEIQIVGTVWTGKNKAFITLVPQKLDEDLSDLKLMPLSLDEWLTLLKQTDVLETEMLENDETGLVKKLYRKSQRQIDAYVQWAVFQRDNYRCRYCGRTGIPLTVDHIDLYEAGGATIPDNLISACKSCNKERGKMEYAKWLESKQYKIRSAHLPQSIRTMNEAIAQARNMTYLKSLRVEHIRSR